MTDIIELAGTLISEGKKLMENEAVAKTVSGLYNWIGDTLGGKKSVMETLERAESGEISDEDLNRIKNKLEYVLEDDEQLQKQLAEKLEEVKKIADREGITMVTKTNTINITGDNNIPLQDMDVGGNINIGSQRTGSKPDELIDLDEPFPIP